MAKLLEATLHYRVSQRCGITRCRAAGSRTTLLHPYRLAFAQGGLYLLAYVPAYKDVRTFAVDRIVSVSLEKQTFTPKQVVGDDVFANSLGVNTGPPARVEIEFAAKVAPYVRARVWHTSQQVREGADGTLVLSMNVCHDWALRSWILSWGPFRARAHACRAREGASFGPAGGVRALRSGLTMQRPLRRHRLRRSGAGLSSRARPPSASTRTGSGSAKWATSRCSSRCSARSRMLFAIDVRGRGGLADVANLRLALASIGDLRPVFTTREGIQVPLPGRRQLRAIASGLAVVVAIMVGAVRLVPVGDVADVA